MKAKDVKQFIHNHAQEIVTTGLALVVTTAQILLFSPEAMLFATALLLWHKIFDDGLKEVEREKQHREGE